MIRVNIEDAQIYDTEALSDYGPGVMRLSYRLDGIEYLAEITLADRHTLTIGKPEECEGCQGDGYVALGVPVV